MSGLRFSVAGLLMLGLARACGHAWPKPREIAAAGLVGCLTLLAANATGVWAQQYISTSMAALLQASLPMWLLLLDMAMRTRRATTLSLLGTAMGIGGVLTLMGPNLAGGTGPAMGGAIAILLGMLSWAVGMRLERSVPMPASGAMSAGFSMLAASVAFGAIAQATGEPARVVWSAIPINAWVAIAYLTIVGSCLTFSAFTWLNRNARPELASSFSYVNPLVAVMLGALILGEPLNQGVLVSTVLTVGAVLLVMLPGKPSNRPKARQRLWALRPRLLRRGSGVS
jgi:drug/metabolite transporter (DMT)-like permease